MHIPDGFLDGRTAAVTGLLAVSALSLAVRQTHRHLPRKKVPLMGLAAAFVFAAQMINFPVAGGTSGHLVGGVLCAALLGPSASVLVITAVLIVQCLVFADGGVLALGANVFNMAVVDSVGGYYLYRGLQRLIPGPTGRLAAIAFSGWAMTVLAAVCCAGELAWSDTVRWTIGLPAMAGIHALIGIGEAVITALIIFSIERARPDLLRSMANPPTRGYGEVVLYGTVLAFGLALFVSPFACGWPDGLERVADSLGFGGLEAKEAIIRSPFPDYHIPGLSSPRIATAVAGIIGTFIAFAAALLFAHVLRSKSTEEIIPQLSAEQVPIE